MTSRILRKKVVRDYAWRVALRNRIARGPRTPFQIAIERVDAFIVATRRLHK